MMAYSGGDEFPCVVGEVGSYCTKMVSSLLLIISILFLLFDCITSFIVCVFVCLFVTAVSM